MIAERPLHGNGPRCRGDALTAGRPLWRRAAGGIAVLLAACSSSAPPPDWQLNAKGSLERATLAYLTGNARIEGHEFARARADLARTGRIDLLARAELTRCAARVASLEFDDCPGFAALANDAPAAERAYAAYLAGQATAPQLQLLPAAQRAAWTGDASADALRALPDPFARLVAAGVLLRSGRAVPGVFDVGVDTASAQGWSRPLLAWLQVQVRRAEDAGAADEAARLRRRIAVVLGGAAAAQPAPPAPR
jgi:hypothetical protein